MYLLIFRIANKHTLAFFIAVCNLMMCPLQVDAQPVDTKEIAAVSLANTHLRYLRSSSGSVKTIDYKLYVSFPKNFNTSKQDYPLIVTLDADYSFAITRNMVEHFADRNQFPDTVIVGIAYAGPDAYRAHRTRDYTPSFVANGGYGPQYQALSGGAPQFRDFIQADLIPFMQKEYRAKGARSLVGHSFGGLFTAWVLLNTPTLFDDYVMISPSLWYDDGLLHRLGEKISTWQAPINAYITVGELEVNSQHDMVKDAQRFTNNLMRLKTLAAPGTIHARFQLAQDETHNSIFPNALSRGLRFIAERRQAQ